MDCCFEVLLSTVQPRFTPMFKSTPDDTHTLRQSSELHRLRKTVKRWSKIRWTFLLIAGGVLWGIWLKTDWTLVTNHTAIWAGKAVPLIAKADVYIHSLF
jgi:hypothetical protein